MNWKNCLARQRKEDKYDDKFGFVGMKDMAYVMLKDVCTIKMGQSPNSNSYNDNGDGIPFFQGNADFGERYPVTRKWCSAPTKMAAPEDILISVRAPIGAMNYAKEDCCIGRGLAALTPNKSKVSPEFIFWVLKSKNVELNSKGTGSTFKAIGRKVIEETLVPDIPLEKQIEFSEILDRVYGVIQARKEELQKLNDLVKARFVEMFDGKYPEDTLLNLCNIIDYRGKTPEKVECGLPFITAKNVKMHHMTLEPREYISKETYDKVMVRGFPKEGDVVFTTEAPLGNVCRIPHFDTEFYIGQRIVTIQTDALNPTYLEYTLSDEKFVRKYMGKSSGSTVTGIRVRLLEQLTIPVPPRTLQDEFSIFVHQVDKSKFVYY